jgi:hypothetical protein
MPSVAVVPIEPTYGLFSFDLQNLYLAMVGVR